MLTLGKLALLFFGRVSSSANHLDAELSGDYIILGPM
jgi:hypothetical protein